MQGAETLPGIETTNQRNECLHWVTLTFQGEGVHGTFSPTHIGG
jgi:hypothetical protein